MYKQTIAFVDMKEGALLRPDRMLHLTQLTNLAALLAAAMVSQAAVGAVKIKSKLNC